MERSDVSEFETLCWHRNFDRRMPSRPTRYINSLAFVKGSSTFSERQSPGAGARIDL